MLEMLLDLCQYSPELPAVTVRDSGSKGLIAGSSSKPFSMKKKLLFWSAALLLSLSWGACNKEVETVPLPPFSVFPNPFSDQFMIHFDGNIPANAQLDLKVLNGKDERLIAWENAIPGQSYAVSAAGWEKAVYYVELSINDEVLIQPIVKAK